MKVADYEVILVGDSAGGNLCLVLQNWIIANRLNGASLKQPKSMILNYPGALTSH